MINEKNRIALLGGLCAVFFLITLLLFFSRQWLKKEKTLLQKDVQEISATSKKLDEALKVQERSNGEMGQALKRSEEAVKKYASGLDEERKKSQNALSQLKEKEEEAMQLRTSLEKYRKDRSNLLERLEAQTKAFGDVKGELTKLSEVKRESEKNIEELTKKVEILSKEKETNSLGTIVIKD